MTIYRGPGGTGSATSDADTTLYQDFLNQTLAARDAALQAEVNAELAETNAETAETNAETAATNAANNASSASSSASAAANSASNASSSASAAASSASSASTSATNAANSATAAASSATSAANSASTATTQASNASSSATAAASSASSAATSATNAASSASSASTSAINAANSATSASNSASSAATSATNAANSATSASNSATAAAASASEAAGYAASINPADLVHISGTETITGAKTFSTNPTLSAGTANGVAYLNGSKVLTTGSALTFDGSSLAVTLTSTVTPSVRLYYNGSSQYGLHSMNGNGDYVVESPALNGATSGQLYLKGNAAMLFGVSGSEQMRLTSTGLGIGTSSPNAKLEVAGTTTDVVSRITATTGASYHRYGNSGQTFYVGLDNSTGGGFGAAYASVLYASGAYPMVFYTNANERMRINSSGNLGIGTTSPATLLHVQGNGAEARVQNTTSAEAVISFRNSASSVTPLPSVGTATGNDMKFTAGGAERMRLDSSGNLGLGVTPSAWGSAWKSYQVKNSNVASSNYDLVHASNAYNNGTNWIYATTQTASLYYQNGNSHQWYQAPSGTAGNAISFTQAMTLDASGNLGVGTTSPQARLHAYLAGGAGLRLDSGSNGYSELADVDGTLYITADRANLGNKNLIFRNGGTTERARIDSSGNLLVGTTSAVGSSLITSRTTTGGKFPLAMNGQDRGVLCRLIGSEGYAAYFERNNGTYTGDIYITSSSTTLYTSASDYRLKENIQPMTGALDKVALLKPCTYDWKQDGSAGEGFIAHEVQQVIPQAVRGEKDAVDADGNPVYQGIDTSFLVATLTAAIQEQQAIIEQLKARLDAANL